MTPAEKQDKKAKGKSSAKAEGSKQSGKKKGRADAEAPAEPAPTPRLLERYEREVLPALADSLGRRNRLSLPRLEKIVINMGVGAALQDKKFLDEAVDAFGCARGWPWAAR